MIFIGLRLTNPWAKEWYGSGYVRDYRLTKNKNFEIQAMRSPTIVMVGLTVTHRCDHAGARLEIGLLGFDLILTLYDSRHWDYENGQYENYGEENE